MIYPEDYEVIAIYEERFRSEDVLIHAALFDPEDYFKCGVIRKEDLQDGVEYIGDCRNSTRAVWSAPKQCFEYIREKFNCKFIEPIHCLENFEGFDIFLPFQECKIGNENIEDFRFGDGTRNPSNKD